MMASISYLLVPRGPSLTVLGLDSRNDYHRQPRGKEGKSLAPIREVDRGGEIAGPLLTWPGSHPQNFPLDFLEDPCVL